MERIVKEILVNGDIRYKIESNRTFFGLIPTKWHTVFVDYKDMKLGAVFATYEEATNYIDFNPVVKRIIINE